MDFATRLHSPRKGDMIHALVSRRSETELSLLAFLPAEEVSTDTEAFLGFFETEVQLNRSACDVHNKGNIQLAYELTPTRKHKQAMEAARILATPEPWAKRSRT